MKMNSQSILLILMLFYSSQQCATNQYYTNTGSCVNCVTITSRCLTCNSNLTCTSCESPYFLFEIDNTCNLVCPTGYTPNNSICQLCEDVFQNCLNCQNNLFTCLNCISGFVMGYQDDLCHISCPSGQYQTTSNNHFCSLCSNQCSTCQNGLNCTSCKDNKYLDQTLGCTTTCSATYGPNQNRICINCSQLISGCILCNSQYDCTTCISNHSFLGRLNLCKQCDIRYCDKCISYSYENYLQCQTCQDGFYHYEVFCKHCSFCENQTYCELNKYCQKQKVFNADIQLIIFKGLYGVFILGMIIAFIYLKVKMNSQNGRQPIRPLESRSQRISKSQTLRQSGVGFQEQKIEEQNSEQKVEEQNQEQKFYGYEPCWICQQNQTNCKLSCRHICHLNCLQQFVNMNQRASCQKDNCETIISKKDNISIYCLKCRYKLKNIKVVKDIVSKIRDLREDQFCQICVLRSQNSQE